MAKSVFVGGSPVPPTWFNSIQNLVFDDQVYDGHYNRLLDDALSNVAGQIKPQWYAFRDELLVTAGSGLSVALTGGRAMLPNHTIATVAPTSIALTNNATNYIFLSASGVAQAATALPVVCLPLAQVLTSGGAISGSIVDLRPRFRISPRPNLVKLFGGGGDEGAFSLTSGSATLNQSEYYFSSFTLGSAATLTCDKLVHIRVAGDVLISGTISVTTALLGGRLQATLPANCDIGLVSGAGLGSPSGQVAGATYSYLAQPFGSGGCSGGLVTGGVASGGTTVGGAGGGGIIIEAQGIITIAASASILAKGGNAAAVGALNSPQAITGGGGGSGGLILLKSPSSIICLPGSTLDVRGGNGADSAGTGSTNGGGGGGGGRVVLFAPSVTTTGANILLTGGTAGLPAAGSSGGGCGGSFGGTGGLTVGPGSPPTTQAGSAGVLTTRTFAPVG